MTIFNSKIKKVPVSRFEWWFEKRRYLLEMGVDGFKTDGGEFIYKDDITFFSGSTGREMRNGFASLYCKAYTDFIGEDRVLFSRAGSTGQQSRPVQWAGDQESTWDELRSVEKAGLTAGMSGIPYWGFDIGGFAGALPSMELYERSTQFAVFTPVMQWHSEPTEGQFSGLVPSAKGINDRSPWNIAEVYGDEADNERLRFHYNLRGNLIPTLYYEAIQSQKSGLPMMRHLALNYPNDPNTLEYDNDFQPAIFVTQDGGLSWTALNINLPESFNIYSKTPLSPIFEGSNGLFPILLSKDGASNIIGTIYLTSDNYGKTWAYDKSYDNLKSGN